MKSHHNESGAEGGTPESDGLTDLHSLLEQEAQAIESGPAPSYEARQKKAPGAPTDFRSLTKGRQRRRETYQRRTATDLLVDAVTPFMILVMVWAVVYFLLDVRFVYTEVHDWNLRFFATFFILGVVALNRLTARDGKDESVIYIIALFGTVVMYTLATTTAYDVGSVSRGFMNSAGVNVFFNLTVVMFVWWLVNRLTHECCVDENYSAGDVGILTGTARKILKSTKKKPEIATYEGTLAAIDPSEWKKPEKKKPKGPLDAASRLRGRHPGISIFYFSAPVMLVFALGQRLVQHGGNSMILAGHFYMACYTVAALSLLMLTSLGGLREYFRARRIRLPGGLGPFWIGLGMVMVAAVLFGAVALPKPGLPPIAYVESHEYDPWNKGSTFQLESIVTPAVEAIQQSRFVERIGTGVLVCLGLFLVYAGIRALGVVAFAIARRRTRYPEWVVRFFDRLDAFLLKIARLPKLPKMRRRLRVDRSIARSARCANPLGDLAREGGSGTARAIEASYDALCALAYDLGVPRQVGQTPFEFIESFPEELDTLKDEAVELTNLYVISAYSNAEMDPKVEDRLRKFWHTYERVRSRVLR